MRSSFAVRICSCFYKFQRRYHAKLSTWWSCNCFFSNYPPPRRCYGFCAEIWIHIIVIFMFPWLSLFLVKCSVFYVHCTKTTSFTKSYKVSIIRKVFIFQTQNQKNCANLMPDTIEQTQAKIPQACKCNGDNNENGQPGLVSLAWTILRVFAKGKLYQNDRSKQASSSIEL